ncbi:hypothetical protein [Streptomyces sp. wa1063]|uniref:hypothetical protein n=1 Tax=Streptomyces sp. wa1063 TaxID=1828212 RepID=UPI0035A0EAAD
MPEGPGAAPAAPVPAAPVPALLVIDMQNTLVAMAYRAAGTVAAIARLQERARAAGAAGGRGVGARDRWLADRAPAGPRPR